MQKGWVYEPVITNYEAVLFYNVMKNHPDRFYYNPIAIARREETGMKYRYLCIAVPKTFSDPPSHIADVGIYKPIAGKPYATRICRLDFDKMFSERTPYI